MKRSLRTLAIGLAVAGTTATGIGLTAASASGTTSTSKVVAVRAGHHTGFDRFVLEFSGPVPSRSITWVSHVTQDGSGHTVRLAGHAFLNVRLANSVAHDASGRGT